MQSSYLFIYVYMYKIPQMPFNYDQRVNIFKFSDHRIGRLKLTNCRRIYSPFNVYVVSTLPTELVRFREYQIGYLIRLVLEATLVKQHIKYRNFDIVS